MRSMRSFVPEETSGTRLNQDWQSIEKRLRSKHRLKSTPRYDRSQHLYASHLQHYLHEVMPLACAMSMCVCTNGLFLLLYCNTISSNNCKYPSRNASNGDVDQCTDSVTGYIHKSVEDEKALPIYQKPWINIS